MSEKEIAWDLSEIFPSCDHPTVSEMVEALKKKAEELVVDYKGKINTPEFSAQKLRDLLGKQEEILIDMESLEVFSYNSFHANMTLPETKALYSKIREFETEISKQLAFIDLEIGKLVYEKKELLEEPPLLSYKHFLEKIRRAFPHLLSEVEEQLILEKDQFGIKAWSQLQSTWLNTRTFKVMVEGEEQELSYGDANALITHPDRGTRISTNKAIYGLLGNNEDIFSSALRSICGDWVNNSKRRKYNSPMHQSLISNDTSLIIIDNLMKTIEDNVSIYQNYLQIKAKIMKLPKLSCADVVAPLNGTTSKKYSWDQTKELILQILTEFNEEFASYVIDMYDKNHVDASTRFGKTNGGYCSPWYKGKTAYILMSYTGKMDEINTLIHEFGHSIHNYLAAQEQSYHNYYSGSTVAEIASTFGELLLTDHLLTRAESPQEKVTILARVLDGAGMAIFQVSARVWFEQSLYNAVEKGEHLDGKNISKFWCASRDKIYGDSVEWFDEMIWEWTMKPHYYMPNRRYYNYPYVYAQLFVYALYQIYKKDKADFVPKFRKILSSGGSLSPKELGQIIGLDITKPDFWQLGIKQYEEFVNELEQLMN